ncbi:MAG: hypothetical protein HZA54_18985 [Planctomycetes bacterium]|nr:hypothetical protein [Planctomycetota bacterium]
MKRKLAYFLIFAVFFGGPIVFISTPVQESLRQAALDHKESWPSAPWIIGRVAWLYRYTGRYELSAKAYEDYLGKWETEHVDYIENKYLYARALEDWSDSLDYNAAPEVGAKRKEVRERAKAMYEEFCRWYPDDPRKPQAEQASRRITRGF